MLAARARNVCCSAQRVRVGSTLLHNTQVWVPATQGRKHLLQCAEGDGVHSTTLKVLMPRAESTSYMPAEGAEQKLENAGDL